MLKYWKVSNVNGADVLTTSRVDEDTANVHTIGHRLRRAFPSAEGYSVKRCTVRVTARPAFVDDAVREGQDREDGTA